MNRTLVDKLVEAVLYEGYILYPYRPSSTKNRQRFTFGRVYPEAYSQAQRGAERCFMQTQCLVQAAALAVHVRFLHPVAREVGRRGASPPAPHRGAADGFEVVPALHVDGRLYQTWQEAVERTVAVAPQPLPALLRRPLRQGFAFPASETTAPLRDRARQVAGVLRRRQQALEGEVELSADAVDERVYRVTVRVTNRTPVPAAGLDDQDEVLLRTFASTHALLHAPGGAFLSLLDPPAAYAGAAAACQNTGAWPVLVGEEEAGERDAMLASPIILYDYPRIAPESPGDFFDGTEVDELLALRIMTMTEEEKREMRQADEHARRLLQRTEDLSGNHLMRLHGTIRERRPAGEAVGPDFFNPNTRVESVAVRGVHLRAGSRVRIRPRGGADIMDLALAGRTAVVEAVEQDVEDRVYLALVLEDDPGKDLGLMRQPGHRFFFSPDEVEPLEGTS